MCGVQASGIARASLCFPDFAISDGLECVVSAVDFDDFSGPWADFFGLFAAIGLDELLAHISTRISGNNRYQ